MSFMPGRRTSPKRAAADGQSLSGASMSTRGAEEGGDAIPLSKQSEEYSRILYLLEVSHTHLLFV